MAGGSAVNAWNAFFLVMAIFGCLGWGVAIVSLAFALYCDLRAYWRDKQVFVKREANVIGFTPNRRRNSNGYMGTN